ncbi:MAG: APC family permease [Candidatus Rokubacteria bacterium]|nr:APC family permease [Candidatus Rokubacteria bacterium]
MNAGPPLPRELSLLPLAAVIFFNVSGGPYGIEDVVPSFGPGLTLLLLIVTPLVWSLPVALAMAELSSALPDEGGYVSWVKRAFGPFWAFQVAWWSWVGSFVDVALYPVLFIDYLGRWLPDIGAVARWSIALGFIWLLTLLNIRGVRLVGWSAVVLGALAFSPVVGFLALGLGRVGELSGLPFSVEGKSLTEGLGVGLAVMMWNFAGWDNPTTCLGETRTPESSYRRALWLSLPVVVLTYLIPVAVGLGAEPRLESWTSGSLSEVGARVAGPWLAGWVTSAALLSAAGLFLSNLLTNSRLPFVLSRDRLLPPSLGLLHPRYRTPWAAVVASSVIYSILALLPFTELVVLDVWLYSIALLFELGAFLAIRLREPALHRPWVVPGGLPGAVLVVVVPSLLALLAMATSGLTQTMAGLAAALTGPLAYLAFRPAARRG